MASRTTPSARDMVIALLVLLLPILVISWFFTRVPEPPIQAADLGPVLARAEAESPYPVALPAGLPDGWVCVRARWTPKGEQLLNGDPAPGNSWQLGYLTPAQMYLGIDQRDAAIPDLIAATTRAGVADGTSELPGASWQRYLSKDGRTRSLVSSTSGVTTVVSGDVPYAKLEAFVQTFRR